MVLFSRPSSSKSQEDQKVPDIDDSDAFDTDLESGEESSSESEEEEKRKAPNELMMEVL